MPAIDALSVYQFGVQSSFGTAVAASAKLAIQRLNIEAADERQVPALAKGLMVRNRGDEFVTRRGVNWSIPDTPMYYEQLQAFLLTAVKGGVSAVGAAAPYTWTFTRDPAADPALDPWTIQRRVTDGTNNNDLEVADCFASQIGLSYAENEALNLSAEGFGRAANDSPTFTASLTMPEPEFIPSALSEVYIDSTWATLGGTKIAGQVIGWDWTFNTGYAPKMTADGRSALDYTVAILDPGEVQSGLTITTMMTKAQYDVEKAAAKAQTLRAIRIKAAGTADRELTIDGLYKYATPDILVLDEDEGQVTVALELEESTDETNLLSIVLKNTTDDADGVGV